MTTEKQINANRRNALKSTGPSTSEGKAAASQNATKHGIFSKRPVVPGLEEYEEWDEYRDGMLEYLAPEGNLETSLTIRVAETSWRLRRVTHYESEVTALGLENAEADANFARTFAVDPAQGPQDYRADHIKRRRILPRDDELQKITRYEAHLSRQMYQALHELQRLQAQRRDGAVVAPPLREVNVSK